MEGGITKAVIWGSDSYVAKYLGEKLKEQGIKVLNGNDEEVGEANYYFDFEGHEENWQYILKGSRLVVIALEDFEKGVKWKEKLKDSFLNWRVVVGKNVYGPGMESGNFISRAFELAAKNKNLILPSLKQNYALLAVEDLVEAILRACFLSGSLGKIFCIEGRETNSKLVAEVLVDEAKMTRFQVIESNQIIMSSDDEAKQASEEARKILRWEAKISFKEGAKGTVQYFVARADEENRAKPIKKKIEKYSIPEREEVNSLYEVVTEEDQAIMSPDGDTSLVENEIEIEDQNPLSSETEDTSLEEGRLKKEESVEMEEKFNWESLLNKSPLPDRAIMSPEGDTSPVKIEKKETENEIIKTEPKKNKFTFNFNIKNKNYFKWILGGILGIFFIFFLAKIVEIVRIPGEIKKTMSLIEEGKYQEAEKKIEYLQKNNEYWLGIMGGGKIGSVLKVEENALRALNLSSEIAQDGQKIAAAFFGEKESEMKDELQSVSSNLEGLISELGILEGRLSSGWQWLPGRYRESLTNLKDKISEKRQTAEDINKLMPIIPEFLGMDGKKREYMVLLQNENELRGSGGFIGSYAILSVEGGQWQNLEIKDIYEADGQLKGHVEPPEEIKNYLGEAGWFMRDANWKASFPEASTDIQWFLEKETGRKVDGVIAINLATVKELLGVLGEVYVPDFKEKVNQDNLYEEAEYYAENKFFAGSGQKASFLGALSKQLLEEIKSVKGSKSEKLIESLVDLLNKREIQISLNNDSAKLQLKTANWDGGIYQGKCASTGSGQGCLTDYLYIVESNFGVNKANYFIYRNIERGIVMAEDGVENDIKISYENTAKSNAWPGGDYKNYLRVYLPEEANLVEINWVDENGNKNMISGEVLKISSVSGKKEVGFLVTVPVGKKIKVEIKYTLMADLKSLQKFSYLNYMQKQSGFGDTGVVTLISVPKDWQILGVNPAANVVGGKLLFNQKLDKDIKMGVEIGR